MLIEVLVAIVLLLMLVTRLGINSIEHRHPAVGTYYSEGNGSRLHYKLSGEQHAEQGTLVLLHGASSNLLEFESSIAPLLAERYRVVTIDRPGLGHSDRSASVWPSPHDQAVQVQALLEQLEIDAPILIGHSWSGALVMSHLLAFPDYARAAVLIAPATHSWGGPPATYNRISRMPIIGWLFRWTLVLPVGSVTLNQGLKSVFYCGEVPDGYRRQAGIDLILRPRSWHANADDLCLLDDFLETQETRYPEVKVPVLAIIGASDQVVINEIHVGGLTGALAELTVVEMAETGHSPHQSHPQRTADAIRIFIENNRVGHILNVVEHEPAVDVEGSILQ